MAVFMTPNTTYTSTNGLTVTLTDHQKKRIKMGATSLPGNQDLFVIGAAHTVNKMLTKQKGNSFE